MAHHTIRSGYSRLIDRLNRFPQGGPPSKLLNEILKMLFSEKEAELVWLLPIKPFSAEKVSRIWEMNKLAEQAILVDIEQNGNSVYALPPPMAGFFEFSLMRVRDDIDQKLLSKVFTSIWKRWLTMWKIGGLERNRINLPIVWQRVIILNINFWKWSGAWALIFKIWPRTLESIPFPSPSRILHPG